MGKPPCQKTFVHLKCSVLLPRGDHLFRAL